MKVTFDVDKETAMKMKSLGGQQGWHNEPIRHGLAAQGIQTGQQVPQQMVPAMQPVQNPQITQELENLEKRAILKPIYEKSMKFQSDAEVAKDISELSDIMGGEGMTANEYIETFEDDEACKFNPQQKERVKELFLKNFGLGDTGSGAFGLE